MQVLNHRSLWWSPGPHLLADSLDRRKKDRFRDEIKTILQKAGSAHLLIGLLWIKASLISVEFFDSLVVFFWDRNRWRWKRLAYLLMLTWASVFGLIADGLRAWNDGKWATRNEQTLHFKRSSGHLNAKRSSCSICRCSLKLSVITAEARVSPLHLCITWSLVSQICKFQVYFISPCWENKRFLMLHQFECMLRAK